MEATYVLIINDADLEVREVFLAESDDEAREKAKKKATVYANSSSSNCEAEFWLLHRMGRFSIEHTIKEEEET